MEDQERIEGKGEDVEAHRRKHQYQAAEDASDESEDEGNDVEAHQLRRPPTSG
jgi:hypothetical protein